MINLQPGVKFQDGEDFNADAVVLNINTYAKGPLSGLAIGPMFKEVKALDPDDRRGRPDPALGRLPQQLPDGRLGPDHGARP